MILILFSGFHYLLKGPQLSLEDTTWNKKGIKSSELKYFTEWNQHQKVLTQVLC